MGHAWFFWLLVGVMAGYVAKLMVDWLLGRLFARWLRRPR